MEQTLINIAFAMVGVLGGFILKSLWNAVTDLQTSDKQLAEKVSGIEVLVAGNYITRPEFKQTIDALFAKMDRISEKLDAKANK